MDLLQYKYNGKKFVDNTLLILFKSTENKVSNISIKLINVVGFQENPGIDCAKNIKIETVAGSYGTDLSIRLNNHNIGKYQELFIYTDKTNCCFRAIAQTISIINQDNFSLNF